MDGYNGTSIDKWMIWGYPYFRKPTYVYNIAIHNIEVSRNFREGSQHNMNNFQLDYHIVYIRIIYDRYI